MEDLQFIDNDNIRIKQGVYTICFVLLCIIDMLMGSAMGRVQMTAANCTGLILGVITLTGYKWKDFFQVPYFLWALAGGIATYLAIIWGMANKNYRGQWISAVLVVYLYGFIAIRLLYRYIVEKKYPKMNWPYFIFWCVMMIGMIFSKNDLLWPIMFFVCFGCFYLTDFSKEEKSALFDGALNGIIIGFLIIQGFATMFRAYDETRYVGMYTNSNMNALFYLMVHTAILCKWYRYKKTGAAVGWRIFAAVGSCILFCYGMLTIGRTAIIGMVINTLLFVIVSQLTDRSHKYVLLKISVRLVSLVVVSALSLPVVFNVCRCIPAHFYSPFTVFFEKDLEHKIHESADFYDTRYMTWDRFLEESFGRFGLLFQPGKKAIDVNETIDFNEASAKSWKAIGEFVFPSMKAYAGDVDNDIVEIVRSQKEWGTGESEDTPVLLDPEDWENSYLIRMAIYRTYLSKVGFGGHPSSEDGVWITSDYFAPHAHDVFIQMFFSHGILVGILFILDVLFLLFWAGKKVISRKNKEWGYMLSFLFTFAFAFFSAFEIGWNYGQLSFFLFFFAHYLVMKKSKLTDNDKVKMENEVSHVQEIF